MQKIEKKKNAQRKKNCKKKTIALHKIYMIPPCAYNHNHNHKTMSPWLPQCLLEILGLLRWFPSIPTPKNNKELLRILCMYRFKLERVALG